MRIRRRPTPLLLLLVPALLSPLAVNADKASDVIASAQQLVRDALPSVDPADYVDTAGAPAISPTAKMDKGTKHAPVDGLDGMPHAGPFVDAQKSEKHVASVEDLVPGKNTIAESKADKNIPGVTKEEIENAEEFPGVMDDRNRVAPKQGTTGTEGGVSEKEKERKAKEKEGGAPVGKQPEKPKEAPPLPPSEDEIEQPKAKIGKEREKTDALEEKDAEKPKGAVGLEVCGLYATTGSRG